MVLCDELKSTQLNKDALLKGSKAYNSHAFASKSRTRDTHTSPSGDRIIWLYITCSSYLESHLSSRPSFVTRIYIHIYIYIYPCTCLYVYECTVRLRYRCAVGSCNATNCRHDWEERERERKRVGIQVFLNVSRKHSSIKVLPAYEENIDNDDYYYYYRGHSFIPERY